MLRNQKKKCKFFVNRYLTPHWKPISVSSLALVVSTGASVCFPYYVGKFVDSCRENRKQSVVLKEKGEESLLVAEENKEDRPSHSMKDFVRGLGILASIYGLVGVATYVRNVNMQTASQRIARSLRRDIYHQLMLQKPVSFFSRSDCSGPSLSNRLTNDVEVVSDFISKNSMTGVRAIGEGIGGLAFLFSLSSHLANTIFIQAWIPATLVIGYLYSKNVKMLNKQYLESLSAQSSFASERLSNMKTMVYPFGRNRDEVNVYENKYLNSLFQYGRKLGLANGVFEGLLYMGTHMSILVMVVMGTLSILDSSADFTLGNLSSILLYSVYVVQSYGTLSSIYSKYQKSKAAWNRLSELLDSSESGTALSSSTSFLPKGSIHSGCLEFRNVCFSYPERSNVTVLNNFNLKISHGQLVVIVGPSGSGKSSLSVLLSKFYSISEGSILLDNQDIQSIDTRELRSDYIAVVPQHPALFHCSILENIVFGSDVETIDMDLVIRLCKMVDIHDFITTKLSHGYQTVLGDNATQLSGGQKQRLNICRTLYFYHNKRAVVYVLDECTSNLDAHSDEKVMNQVVDYIQEEKKATCLIVTHKSMHKHLASRIDQTIQIQTRAKE